MIPEWKALQRERERAWKNRGMVIHQANYNYINEFGIPMKKVLDGQYEPHGGRGSHVKLTKAEKKADRKARTWTKFQDQAFARAEATAKLLFHDQAQVSA
jgi:hypothetical protein